MEKRHLYHCTATGIVLNENLSQLLLIEKKSGSRAGWWFPPGGHIEIGEYPHEALIREVEEETGYEVEIIMQDNKVGEKLGKAIIQPQPYWILLEDIDNHYHYDMIYVCKIINKVEKCDPDCKFKWFPLSEIKDLMAPEDVKSLISAIR
jgi:8-oxo-dGTP pyrophosphatase MutT (NUDIX family)